MSISPPFATYLATYRRAPRRLSYMDKWEKEIGFGWARIKPYDADRDTIEINHWRSRWSTTTSRAVDENILVLRKRSRPGGRNAQN